MSVGASVQIAWNKSKLPSASERVESCKKFWERARQRVSRAQDVMDKATAQEAIHEPEVAERGGAAPNQVEASKPRGGSSNRSQFCRQIDALEMQVVQRRPKGKASGWHKSSLCRRNSTHAQGIGRLVKRPEVRFADCNRVREPRNRQSDRVLVAVVVEGQSRSAMVSDLRSKRRGVCLSSGAG